MQTVKRIVRPKDYQECNSWPTHARELPLKGAAEGWENAPTHMAGQPKILREMW